jgi:hypothetical protein
MESVRGRSLPPATAGNSNSWSNTRTLEGARLLRLLAMASHLSLSKSPFFPKNIGQYAKHLQEVHADKLRIESERLQEHIDRSKLVEELGMPFKCKQFLNGKVLEFKFVDEETSERERVWPYGTLNDDEETAKKIGWPSTSEIKLEGEQRAKKGLKRQLPVPKRKVDEEMAGRLITMGMKVETAVGLLHAPEEMVGVGEDVPLGGHEFDEAELENSGKWAELLHKMNEM